MKRIVVAALFSALSVVLLSQAGVLETARLRLTTGPCDLTAGSGTPEGTVTGNVCDLFLRTNGSTGAVLYVKTSGSGNTGWQTTSSGGNAPSSGATPGILTRKVGDQSLSTSTTFQDDDAMNASIAASETWVLSWVLQIDAGSTGDIKFALNVPASATGIFSVTGLQIGATTATDNLVTASTTTLTDSGVLAIGGAGSGTPVVVRASALVVNSTNAGTIKLRWAQNASDGTASKVLASSYVLAQNMTQVLVASSTFASLPTAATPGRLFFPTDAAHVYRDTGTTWALWGPIVQFTTPADTGFAWVNQGTSTLDTTKESLTITTPADAGTTNLRMRVKTAPATPWTLTAFMHTASRNKNFYGYSLLWRNSGSGNLITCGFQANTSGGWSAGTLKYNSGTSFNAAYTPGWFAGISSHYSWIRITDDGTNRVCLFSQDGLNFTTYHSIGRTDFITADQFGFEAHGTADSAPQLPNIVTLLSWKVS